MASSPKGKLLPIFECCLYDGIAFFVHLCIELTLFVWICMWKIIEIGLKYLGHCGLVHHFLAFILNQFAITMTSSGAQHSVGYAIMAVLISPASAVSAVFNPHSLAKYLKAVKFSVLTR